jgi:hypothetical protein
MCSMNKTPLLNDISLFNINNRTWYRVRYTEGSELLDYLGNHSVAVMSDGTDYERVVIFGGLLNKPSKSIS